MDKKEERYQTHERSRTTTSCTQTRIDNAPRSALRAFVYENSKVVVKSIRKAQLLNVEGWNFNYGITTQAYEI